jgi:hypothetical protein
MVLFRNTFFAILFISVIPLFGQETELLNRLSSLNYTDQLPKEILSSKTVVIVKTPEKNLVKQIRGDWSKIAETAQKGFKKANIDAVAYYYFDDLFSGPESYDAFLDAFDERDLTHAAFIFFDGQSYKLILLKLQDRKFLLKTGQDALKVEGPDLNKIMDNLYRNAANSGLKTTNLLIIENPQYGEMVDVIKGKRSEFYDLNFSSEKLAVPKFADSLEIANVMLNYPYKWEMVPLSIDEKELIDQGFQYVLYYAHSTAKSVKKILEYPTSSSETAYVSEVIINKQPEITSYDINASVYKFYIKHIRTQNTFIGKRWDAGLSWQKALDNYIQNLRNELVRN